MSIGGKAQLKGQTVHYVPFLTHPGEPVDAYSEYLSNGPQPADESSNPRNLFDDSNKIDRIWLKRAQNYLKNYLKELS